MFYVRYLRRGPHRGWNVIVSAFNDFSFTSMKKIPILLISIGIHYLPNHLFLLPRVHQVSTIILCILLWIVKSEEVVDYQLDICFVGDHYQPKEYPHTIRHHLRNYHLIVVHTLNDK